LAAVRNGRNYKLLKPAILYRVEQDRWFIAAVVGLSALTVLLVGAALFYFG
jgi:hypothetical protein